MTTFDRSSHLRESAVEALRRRDDALAVVFRGGHPLLDGDGASLATLPASALDSGTIASATFLGVRGGIPLFLADLDDEAAERAEAMWPMPPTVSTFREAAPDLAPDDAEILAFAQGLLNWQRRSGFCPGCGSEARLERAGHVRVCTNDACAAQWFPRIDPVVIMLVTRGDELLLVRHRRARSAIFFSAVAGFVEHGETLEQAVARETLEEVGLEVTSVRYFGSQAWPLPTSIMVGFVAEAAAGEPRIDEEELIEAKWFDRAALGSGNVSLPGEFSIARRMIEWWTGLKNEK